MGLSGGSFGSDRTALSLALPHPSTSLMADGSTVPYRISPLTSESYSSMDGDLETEMSTSTLTSKSIILINNNLNKFQLVSVTVGLSLFQVTRSPLTLNLLFLEFATDGLRHVSPLTPFLELEYLMTISKIISKQRNKTFFMINFLSYSHLDSISDRVGTVSVRCGEGKQLVGLRVGAVVLCLYEQISVFLCEVSEVYSDQLIRFLSRMLRASRLQTKRRLTTKTRKTEETTFVNQIFSCNMASETNKVPNSEPEKPRAGIVCDAERGNYSNDGKVVDGTPPSYRSFGCSSVGGKVKNGQEESRMIRDTMPGAPEDDDPVVKSPDPVAEDDEEIPSKDITTTPVKSTTPLSPSMSATTERSKHECLNNLVSPGNKSDNRHDVKASVSPQSDDHSRYEIDPGTVLDPSNEGDAAILTKLASGTSNLTEELVHLKSGSTSDGSPRESLAVGPSSTPPDCSEAVDSEPCTAHQRDDQENQEREVSVIKDNTKRPGNTDADDDNPSEYADDDHEERSLRQMDDQHAAFDRCEKFCQRGRNVTPDSSDSYDPPNSTYSGGLAGLDPDHSAQWVPSYIDVNDSKSKKRRRRQKKKKELQRQQDSLGKLLRGEQSKEDADYISTLDLENQRLERKKARLQKDSEILGGNLQQSRGRVQDIQGKDDFTATLNSTKHGQDFDDLESLREGSDKEELVPDENIEAQDRQDDDNADDEHGKDELSKEDPNDDSLSSNSTGTRRKRKRNKKNIATKQTKPVPPVTGGPEATGRSTRSKAQNRATTEPSEDQANKKNNNDDKGEKEKRATEPLQQDHDMQDPAGSLGAGVLVPVTKNGQENSTLAQTGASQVAIFKQPKVMSRTDIQRIVTKAVQKSRSKISGNFAFNSKIQKFKVITDSADVKKFPDIDNSAPLKELSIPEFIWPDEEKTMAGMVSVKSRGVVQFVILARSGHVAHDAWDTPKLDMVRDFASFLLCTIADLKLEFGTILRWTNPWGNVVVMGLDTADLDMLQRFRTFFTTLRFSHHYFNTFPKDAMTSSLGISVMLKNDLRQFKEEFLAEALFARNKLFGVLETVEAETYTASDTTRAGVSKNGWRNVILEGDETFLASLADFPAMHWFNIGPASVQIHGGERRAETEEEIEAKNRRRRMNMPYGQALTNAARSEISQAFLLDQKKLLASKKSTKTAASTPAPTPSQHTEAAKAQVPRRRK